jgi:prephenate dehydrogenase
MPITFDKVAIIGVGLLGGSLGLALKRRQMASIIVGVGRREESLRTAKDLGAIDEGRIEVVPAVEDADLVVICTPAALVPSYLTDIEPLCKNSAVITDVASTKAAISSHARDTWTFPLRVVGSHPMAGSEKFGPEHATASLYEGAVCFVERGDYLDPEARAVVVDLWISVGARVIDVDPAMHDEMVALTSHVPHIAAAALAQLPDPDATVRSFIGNGFLDMTRIAEGRPELWTDICLTNPFAIRDGLDAFIEKLREVSDAIHEDDPEKLTRFFAAGREARLKALGE